MTTELLVEPTVTNETLLAQEAESLVDPALKIVAAGKFLPLTAPGGGVAYGEVTALKANGLKLRYEENLVTPGNDFYEATFVTKDRVTGEERPAPRPDCNYQIFVSPYTEDGVDASVATLQNIQTFPCEEAGFKFAVWQNGARVSAPLSIQVVDFTQPQFS
jgi:hypothetical protein